MSWERGRPRPLRWLVFRCRKKLGTTFEGRSQRPLFLFQWTTFSGRRPELHFWLALWTHLSLNKGELVNGHCSMIVANWSLVIETRFEENWLEMENEK